MLCAATMRSQRRQNMAHTIDVPNELYEKLMAVARKQQQTPESLFLSWAASITEQPATSQWGSEPPPTEEELREHPLLGIAGSLSIGDPRLASGFDNVLAEAIADEHADGDRSPFHPGPVRAIARPLTALTALRSNLRSGNGLREGSDS